MVNPSENSVMVITKLLKSSCPVAPFILLHLSSCAYSRSHSPSSQWKWVASLRNLDAFWTSQLHRYPFSSNTVFFPFIGLDFKPKFYDLVFSKVNTIRADVLTQLSSITAVTNPWQPSHGCPPSPKLPRCWLVVLWAKWAACWGFLRLQG